MYPVSYLDYEEMWNVYIHSIPMTLLLLDFGVNRRVLRNNWRDTLKFYYLICVPINLGTYRISQHILSFRDQFTIF